MRKPKPNLFEHLEKARQQQMTLMERFTQAQTRITQVEERLQTLQARRPGQATKKQSEEKENLSTNGFLPADGDLELETGYAEQSEEEQETERLTRLRPDQSSAESSKEADALSASEDISLQATVDLEQA